MKKITTVIPGPLQKIVRRATIEADSKAGGLDLLLKLAYADVNKFVDDGHFGLANAFSCTLFIDETAYAATRDYRIRNDLTTRTGFLLHALKHGATIFEKLYPLPIQSVPSVDSSKSEQSP